MKYQRRRTSKFRSRFGRNFDVEIFLHFQRFERRFENARREFPQRPKCGLRRACHGTFETVKNYLAESTESQILWVFHLVKSEYRCLILLQISKQLLKTKLENISHLIHHFLYCFVYFALFGQKYVCNLQFYMQMFLTKIFIHKFVNY